jgi:hypothetical protein
MMPVTVLIPGPGCQPQTLYCFSEEKHMICKLSICKLSVSCITLIRFHMLASSTVTKHCSHIQAACQHVLLCLQELHIRSVSKQGRHLIKDST